MEKKSACKFENWKKMIQKGIIDHKTWCKRWWLKMIWTMEFQVHIFLLRFDDFAIISILITVICVQKRETKTPMCSQEWIKQITRDWNEQLSPYLDRVLYRY